MGNMYQTFTVGKMYYVYFVGHMAGVCDHFLKKEWTCTNLNSNALSSIGLHLANSNNFDRIIT